MTCLYDVKNIRYLSSFNFCGMFQLITPTAACGTCCQRVNCVGFLNVHHHVAFEAWSFLLGFCMAVLKSLISVHLADLGSSVFGLACPCSYEAVIQTVSSSIHSLSLYILLMLVYTVGEWNASSEYFIVHLKQPSHLWKVHDSIVY